MNEQLTQIYGYLHGMWEYRWSALIIAWIVAAIGWPVVFALPDKFSSKAVVYIDTSSVMTPLLKGLALETDSKDELQVMSRVLLSRENLLSVMRETDMDLEASTPLEREKMVEALARGITIQGGGSGNRWDAKTNIYEISYQDRSANRSYQVVSNLLNTMIEDTLSSTRTDTATAQKFLDTQIAEYEQRLSVAELQLAEFKKANVGFMPDEKGGYYMRLQRAQDAKENSRSKLSLATRRLFELKRQLRGESPVLSGNGYLSTKDVQIKQSHEQLDSLLSQFTEQHPDVLALRSRIEDLKNNKSTDDTTNNGTAGDTTDFNPVYQEMRVELSKASIEVETLKIQLAQQEAYVTELQGSIDVIPEVEAKLAKLNRGYEVTRDRYLDLLERREATKLSQSAGQSTSEITFRIIEPPIVPYQPSAPNRLLLLTGVLLGSLASGLGWCLLRYQLRPAFMNLNELAAITGLPVLGSVSLYMSPEHITRRRMQLASFLSATFLLILVFGVVLRYQHLGVAFFVSLSKGF